MIPTKKYLNELTYQIIGAAIEVHKYLGPGLLESVYHKCMIHELGLRSIDFQTELNVEINYKDLFLSADLRCDLFVENYIMVELKAVDIIAPVFEAKLLSYMKLKKSPKGILINFNVTNLFKEGQRTYVNELFANLMDE